MAARRRLCPDSEQTSPHFIDVPGARRCAQHAAQRHLWSDANAARQRRKRPARTWIPDPVPPDIRDEAARILAPHKARVAEEAAMEIEIIARQIAGHARTLRTEQRKTLLETVQNLADWANEVRHLAHDIGADNRLAKAKPRRQDAPKRQAKQPGERR